MSYRVPTGAGGSAELRERGSRFLAVVMPAADESTAKQALEALRRAHSDATHHCWAWRLGWPPRERSADAGEPAGTAGVPILQVLRGAELSDVLAVVVRWFGGTKLGKGGLARAYASAVRAALDELPTRLDVPSDEVAVEASYESLGALKRLIRPPAVELIDERYGEGVRLVLRVECDRRQELDENLADLGLSSQTV